MEYKLKQTLFGTNQVAMGQTTNGLWGQRQTDGFNNGMKRNSQAIPKAPIGARVNMARTMSMQLPSDIPISKFD